MVRKKYIKKPVVIEAYQTKKAIKIKTLEGIMQANKGDWIIAGINGEKYPCKPDIFKKTYKLYEPIKQQYLYLYRVNKKDCSIYIMGKEPLMIPYKYVRKMFGVRKIAIESKVRKKLGKTEVVNG